MTEIVVPLHNAGPPLHTHDFDEAFYLLEGELIFQVQEALATKGRGELSSPAATCLTRSPTTATPPARYLLVCTPAGFERYWARVAADAPEDRTAAMGAAAYPRGHGRRPADSSAGVTDMLLAFLEALSIMPTSNRQNHSEQPLLNDIGITRTSAYS